MSDIGISRKDLAWILNVEVKPNSSSEKEEVDGQSVDGIEEEINEQVHKLGAGSKLSLLRRPSAGQLFKNTLHKKVSFDDK